MPAARQEHRAAQFGPSHSQRVLGYNAEFGNKAKQGLALTLEVLICKKRDVPMQACYKTGAQSSPGSYKMQH